jgi:hypothetical protein
MNQFLADSTRSSRRSAQHAKSPLGRNRTGFELETLSVNWNLNLAEQILTRRSDAKKGAPWPVRADNETPNCATSRTTRYLGALTTRLYLRRKGVDTSEKRSVAVSETSAGARPTPRSAPSYDRLGDGIGRWQVSPANVVAGTSSVFPLGSDSEGPEGLRQP